MSFLNKIKEAFLSKNVLYYPGCLTKFAAPELEKKYKKILDIAGIDYIQIPEFYCCGSPVLNAGYENDFYKLVEKNQELFRKYGIRKIITSCGSCLHMFKNHYDFEVEHITKTILDNIDKFKKTGDGEEITYHDPCHLGRKNNIYEAPRKILEKLGYKVVEFKQNREHSVCCGAGGGLKTNAPKLANKIAKRKIKEVKTKRMVTCCALCTKHFGENSGKIDVVELAELMVK